MIRKNWSEGDISAYLDGRLGSEARAAFEADLAHDPTLRQQVAVLRATVALIRAVPLREPPRNYLLTPAMVAAPARRAPQRPRPLLWMRLATSLTAVAFTISLTLNVLRGMTPAMAPHPMDESAPLSAPAAKEAAPTAEVLLLEAPAPNEMVVELATTAVVEENPQERTILAPDTAPPGMGAGTVGETGEGTEIDMGAEPTPGIGEGTVAGMGAPPEAEQEALPTAVEQPTPMPKAAEGARPAATPAPETQLLAVESTTAGADASSDLTMTQSVAVEDMTFDTEAETIVASTDGEIYPRMSEPFPPPWVTAILGVVTLILAGTTLWLWRRE